MLVGHSTKYTGGGKKCEILIYFNIKWAAVAGSESSTFERRLFYAVDRSFWGYVNHTFMLVTYMSANSDISRLCLVLISYGHTQNPSLLDISCAGLPFLATFTETCKI